MIRINIVAEGKSELFFVQRALNRYFATDIPPRIMSTRCIMTHRDTRTNYEHRGGLVKYEHVKKDIVNWLKEDRGAYVSTMFDLYALPSDFPAYDEAMCINDHNKSVQILEAALKRDIDSKIPDVAQNRFVPYIQLHEFEALLYTDIRILKYDFMSTKEIENIERLYFETKDIPPEEINNGPETAPSKRLLHALDYRKGDAPTDWLEAITIDAIRSKCPHFNQWIKTLSTLPALYNG